MKFCPMCGIPQLEKGVTTCQFCDYTEQPIEALSSTKIRQLMAPYEYTKAEGGGLRIEAVKNIRDISLRGAVGIPSIVTEIGDEAFSLCKFLARIELPKALRWIGDGAFAHCRDLFDVFIPESVTHMGTGVFANCYDLRVVQCAAPQQPEGWHADWLADCDARVEWGSTEED